MSKSSSQQGQYGRVGDALLPIPSTAKEKGANILNVANILDDTFISILSASTLTS